MGSKTMSQEEKEEYDRLTKETEQISLFGRTYGYARISRPKQSIERQIRNIRSEYPDAHIVLEAYTGRTLDRPEWNKLLKRVQKNDTIIFDSVSRMSRSADEGVQTYFDLYEKGIQLVFLKEHYIDTEIYAAAVRQSIPATGNDIADIYIEATNKVIRLLAEQQIRKAFEQAEKEVVDLSRRTSEGMETARLNGKQIGQKPGQKLHTKKGDLAKEVILQHSLAFNGSLHDDDCRKLAGVSRNTYYKYKRELKKNR